MSQLDTFQVIAFGPEGKRHYPSIELSLKSHVQHGTARESGVRERLDFNEVYNTLLMLSECSDGYYYYHHALTILDTYLFLQSDGCEIIVYHYWD